MLSLGQYSFTSIDATQTPYSLTIVPLTAQRGAENTFRTERCAGMPDVRQFSRDGSPGSHLPCSCSRE